MEADESWGVSLICHLATSSIAELREIESVLNSRMAVAERTARALREARDNVNAELMLAKAHAEADAWATGKQRAAPKQV